MTQTNLAEELEQFEALQRKGSSHAGVTVTISAISFGSAKEYDAAAYSNQLAVKYADVLNALRESMRLNQMLVEALTQILDDGDHITDYVGDQDTPVFNKNEKQGYYCYGAAEQAMDALQQAWAMGFNIQLLKGRMQKPRSSPSKEPNMQDPITILRRDAFVKLMTEPQKPNWVYDPKLDFTKDVYEEKPHLRVTK